MKKNLTNQQLRFLQMIVKLDNELKIKFICEWPKTVQRVIYKRCYNESDAIGLNSVVRDFEKWKKWVQENG